MKKRIYKSGRDEFKAKLKAARRNKQARREFETGHAFKLRADKKGQHHG